MLHAAHGRRRRPHVEDVGRLLAVGADKVAINTAAVEQPGPDRARRRDRFGAQCVVVSIDAACAPKAAGPWSTHSGTVADRTTIRSRSPRAAEALGAGEILLTSIDRDGTMDGYDLELIRRVAEAVSIPVIASGGAGTLRAHGRRIAHGGAAAVAAASMFHFTEQTPLEAKRFLGAHGIPVRS